MTGPQPQEHRNMPFDDAMSLVTKAFEKHMANKTNNQDGDRSSSIASGGGSRDNSRIGAGHDPNNSNSSQLPNDVRNVIGFLLEQRPLSVMEYDKLIKWLAQQRLGVLKAEYGENIPSELATPPVGPPVDPAVKAQQIELQQRIVHILNKPKPEQTMQTNNANLIDSKTINQFGQTMPMVGDASSGGMDNPLQRAIDNLIRTGPNLLNQTSASGGGGGEGSGVGSNPGSGIGLNVSGSGSGSGRGGGGGDNKNYSGFGLMGNF